MNHLTVTVDTHDVVTDGGAETDSSRVNHDGPHITVKPE